MRQVLMISVMMFACAASIHAQQNPPQDISGGAALIFKRPENPLTRERETATNKQRSAQSDTNDKVEDAIALGNAARDRKPPDFESAEKAYRLAWKLNPSDPRPYVGLGNLYWDQRRYADAAQAYRDAVRHMDQSRNRALSASILSGIYGGGATTEALHSRVQTRIYLAASLLAQEDPLGAELELRQLGLTYSENAEWNSLFGYALAAQGRYSEAIEAYQKALKSEPRNENYKELLKGAIQKAGQVVTNDVTITRRLQNTIWEVRDAVTSTVKGACQLDANGSIRCKSVGSGLLLTNGSWRIRDGIVGLEGTFKLPFCLGRLRATTIDFKCYSSDSESNDLWREHEQN